MESFDNSLRQKLGAAKRRTVKLGLAAALLASCAPSALHAETNAELASEIKALRAQIREMKSAIAETRSETRRTNAKVRAVASRTPAPGYALPPPTMAIPAGATPAFVTADKKLQFGAITITPGGFIAAESVFRSRTTQSDINTDYRAIPFTNSPLGHTNEFRFTPRQSRVALLAEGAITPTMVAGGYLELDFLGATNGSNSNEANGFNPRIRHLYATLDANDYGLHFLAGQSFSLATLNSKGITPRNEVTPPSIDGQYIPGFVWTRQPGIRLTKDFGGKLWLSLAAEQSQTTFASGCNAGANVVPYPTTPAGGTPAASTNTGINGTYNNGRNTLTGITCSAGGTGGGLAGDTNNFSLNHVPDVIAKVAYEAKIADRDVHLEAFGMYRDLYDRVSYNDFYGNGQNANRDTAGWGVGGGLIVPLLPRKLDFQASGLYGRGVGRYGTSQLFDTTFNSDGSLRAIQEGIALAGFTLHATPAIDLYAFGGIERSFRAYTLNSTNTYFGVGAPGATTATATGCTQEPNVNFGMACTSTAAGNTRQIFQLTGGMWDKIYKGSFGEVRVGVQYQYTQREIYNNVATPVTAAAGVVTNSYTPRAYDHAVLTSMRYYPFQ